VAAAILICGSWRKVGHRSLVTPEMVLSEYHEDFISLIYLLLVCAVG